MDMFIISSDEWYVSQEEIARFSTNSPDDPRYLAPLEDMLDLADGVGACAAPRKARACVAFSDVA